MLRLALSLAVAGSVLSMPCMAQTLGHLRGQVVEARTGEVLAGVNVLFPSLNRGAATDIDGSYSVPNLAVGTYEVVARFVGFKTVRREVRIEAGRETLLKIEMEEDILLLDELVVTGLGASVEKRKLSANVVVLHSQEIASAPVTTLDQLLQGRVPGASVRMQSAQPGLGGVITFRGIKSVFADQTPVIYVDGVRMDNGSNTSLSLGGERTSALSELLTSDVERIEIAMGGSASTLYGSEAANGVIQVFTKRGVPGTKNRVVIRVEQGIDTPDTKFVQDTDFSHDDAVEDPSSDVFGQGSFVKDEYLKVSHFQNYHVGVTGGTRAVAYNVSGRVQHSPGIQPSNGHTLYTIRGNLQSELDDKLKVGFSGAYTRSSFERLFNGTALFSPYTVLSSGALSALSLTGTATFEEALQVLLLPDVDETIDRFYLSTRAHYRPSATFASKLVLGLDSRASGQRAFLPIEYDIVSDRDRGELRRFDRDFFALTLEYTGTVSYPRFGAITSDFTFGVQGFRNEIDYMQIVAQTFALPGTEDISQAGEISATETRSEVFNGGFFFREQVGIWDRLFANVGVRVDGNSAFGTDVGLQAYPNVGIAYSVSEEPAFDSLFGRFWNELKLRMSYGGTGRFPRPFDRDVTFVGDSFRGESAPFFDNPGNPELKPERTWTVEGGFETTLLSNRVGVSFTAYRATTVDALMTVPEQPSTGRGLQLRNVAKVLNTGIEVAASADVVQSRSVSLSLRLSYSGFRNEVVDMGTTPEFSVGGDEFGQVTQRVAAGHPVGEWYANTPFDSNGDGLLDAFDLRFAGSTPYPTKTGSITASLVVNRRLMIFALADWSLGARIADNAIWLAEFGGRERIVLPERFDTEGNPAGNYDSFGAGVFLLQDGDFLKLREITVRYSLPSSFTDLIGIESGSVFGSARNVLTFARQGLVDPELSGMSWNAFLYNGGVSNLELGGEQFLTLAPPRQFRLGFELIL